MRSACFRSRVPRGVLGAFITAVVVAWHAAPGAAHEPDAEEIALGSLVDAELAFAKMASQRGVRAAFLANFAPDGVVFEPAPQRLRDTWSARPPPADPLAFHLMWKPLQAGVSRDHDFGYTTGPYTAWNAAEPQRKRHGVFFSVWKRNAQRRWEVVLDAGITTPGEVDFAALRAAPRPRYRGRPSADVQRALLLGEEARSFGSGPEGITPTRYAQLLADDVRLHRDDGAPLASRAAVAREMAFRMSRVTWTPIDARVSAAGDIAVTYGHYRQTDRASSVTGGYYAHLWLRDADGRWRLAYDIALPEPPS